MVSSTEVTHQNNTNSVQVENNELIINFGVNNQNENYKSASNTEVTGKNETNSTHSNCTELVRDTDVDNQNENYKSAMDNGVYIKKDNIKMVLPTVGNDQNHNFNNALPTVGKCKKEVLENLGFSKKQAERFETLSRNKDIIEEIKQKARENDELPTRSQVLSLVQARKQRQEKEQDEYKEFCKNTEKGNKLYNKLIDVLGFIKSLDSEKINLCMMSQDESLSEYTINLISEVENKLNLLKAEAYKYKGVKLCEDN